MRQFNKFKGTRGFLTVYERVLRFRYMITEKAKRKAKIITFFDIYGLEATSDAYGVIRATIFRWKKSLKTDLGKLECLNDKSKAPKKRNKRIIDERIIPYIINQRKEHYRIGKKKLTILIKEDLNISYSESKIGRILFDLKKRDLLPKYVKISMHAKTGRIHERNTQKGKKLRIKDYKPEKSGDVIQIDTVVKFINGVRRYILTAIDVESDFAFAYGYTHLSSSTTVDFFKKLEDIVPFTITHIQTDNGLEFQKHFIELLEKKNIIHFF